jgi:hypothetical protein
MPKLPLRLSSDLVLQIRAYCQRQHISVEAFILRSVSMELETDRILNDSDSWQLPEWNPLDFPNDWDQTPSNW